MWIEVDGPVMRLTNVGRETAARVHRAYLAGDDLEDIVVREGLPSVRHLQLLMALDSESPR